jgi:myo-inositol-1(or 4)-monophosphatase
MNGFLDLALVAAQRAADLLVEGWSQREVVSTKSSGTDVVTQMDRGSEALLIEAILDRRPDDGVIGEEGGRRAGTSGVTWVIDPLDGTVNYLYGLPVWGVSVGVLVDGIPQVGVVNAPALGSVWAGDLGEDRKATHNGTAITVSGCSRLDQALVATGFGYRSEVRAEQAAIVAQLLPEVRDIRRAGAAAVDMCWVAQGCVDAYFERGTHLWDRAAATVICQAAGAEVIGPDGGEATDAMTIAGNPGLAQRLRARLVDAELS